MVSKQLVANYGGGRVHHSHQLVVHRGLLWCLHCGQYSGHTLRGLHKLCPREPSKKGLECLSRLRRGLLPHNLQRWPEDAGQGGVQLIMEGRVLPETDPLCLRLKDRLRQRLAKLRKAVAK